MPKPSVQHGPPSRPSPVVRGRLASATRSFARPGLSFADAVRSRPPPAASSSPNSTVEHLGVNRPPPLTGANVVPLPAKRSVFRRLQPPPVQRRPSLDFAPVNPARILQSLNDRLGDAALHPFCLRCLSNDHYRGQCKSPIRCHACLRWRHTADNCRFKSWTEERRFTVDGNMGRQISAISKKMKSGWSNPAVAGPSKTSPMANGSGNERVQTRPQSSAWAAKGKEPAFNALPKPNTVQATARSSDPLLLSLGASPSTFPPSLTQENPALHSATGVATLFRPALLRGHRCKKWRTRGRTPAPFCLQAFIGLTSRTGSSCAGRSRLCGHHRSTRTWPSSLWTHCLVMS